MMNCGKAEGDKAGVRVTAWGGGSGGWAEGGSRRGVPKGKARRSQQRAKKKKREILLR